MSEKIARARISSAMVAYLSRMSKDARNKLKQLCLLDDAKKRLIEACEQRKKLKIHEGPIRINGSTYIWR